MDDDGIVTLLGILIGIGLIVWLVLWLIGTVVWLIVATLPAWGSGAVSGAATHAAARLRMASHLRSPAKLDELVIVEFDGSALQTEYKPEAVKRYVFAWKIGLGGLCIAVTATVFSMMMMDLGLAGTEENWLHGTLFVILAAITTGSAAFVWTQLDTASALENQVKRALAEANITFQASHELQNTIRDNAVLAGQLQIDFPQDDLSSIRNYVASNTVRILSDPSCLRAVVDSEIEKAKQDGRNLAKAADELQEILQSHQRVSRTIFATGSPSLVNSVDMLHEQIHQAKEACLSNREWETFDEAMVLYTQELEQLEELALNFTTGETPAPNSHDPYRLLGVTTDMTDSEIKRVYRDLCHIYHPDKGKVRDKTRFEEIKSAYDEIRNQRKG